MNKDKLKIVFMGTPDFAVESLKNLVENNYNVVGVVTSPDKPSGRGQKMNISAVKKYALEKNLNILQPEKLKDYVFLKKLEELNADLQIVVAFRMLPQVVWSMPKLGTFNLHSSLLPNYRGAAPINWAIINGEKETGVTTFFLNENIDTGDIISKEKVKISEDMNVGKLHDILMSVGGKLVLKTVDNIISKNITPISQNDLNLERINPAPKIFREDCKINWEDNIYNIYNKIRGLNPYPGAWTEIILDDKKFNFKVFDIKLSKCSNTEVSNGIIKEESTLKVKLLEGDIIINSLQLESKKKMDSSSFINGIMNNKNKLLFYK